MSHRTGIRPRTVTVVAAVTAAIGCLLVGASHLADTVAAKEDTAALSAASGGSAAPQQFEVAADLRVVKFSEPHETVRAGDIFTYTIFVDNLGPDIADNVVITDTLLSSGRVSVQSCAFSVSQGGGAITQFTCTTGNLISTQFGTDMGTFSTNFLDPLSPNSQGRLRASFRLVAREDMNVANTVRVTSDTFDPNLENNLAVDFIAVVAVSDLTITKAATAEEQQTNQPGLRFDNTVLGQAFPTAPNYFVSTRVTAGRRIQYQLNISNTGPSEAENVVVEDRLPAGVQIYQGSVVVTVDDTGTPNPPPVVLPAGACNAGTPGDPADTLTCGLGVLQSGATATIVFQVVTDAHLPVGTVLQNDALVYSDSLDLDNTDNYAFATNTVLRSADLSVSKFCNPAPIQAGTVTSFDILYSNAGPSVAPDTEVTDVLPPGFEVVSAIVVDGDPVLGSATCHIRSLDPALVDSVICEVGDIPPGGGGRIVIEARVRADNAAGVRTNTVAITSDASDPLLSNNTATCQMTLATAADLVVTKTSDPLVVHAGEQKTYTITVVNNGPSNAPNVQVVDTLPANVLYLVDTGLCTVVGQVVTCNAGTLPPGGSYSVEIVTLILSTTPPGLITNCASATSSFTDPNPANNTNICSRNDVVEEADLRIVKYSEPHETVRAGDIFTYTIFVDNLGPSHARNVVITDTLLNSGLVNIQSCAFSVSQGGGAITQFTCTTGPVVSTQFGTDIGTFSTNVLEPLSPDSQGRLRASFRLVANEDLNVANTARVTSDTPDPNMDNNFAVDFIAVTAVSDVTITKAATGEEQQVAQPGLIFNNAIFGQVFPTAPNYFVSTRVTAGRRIQYQLNVSNTGPSEAENVVVQDRLPAGVRIYQGSVVVTVDNTGTPNPPPVVLPAGACNVGTPGDPADKLTCGLGVLQRGATATIVFQVVTDAGLTAGTVLQNDALVYSDSLDLDNTDNYAFASNTVLTAGDLTVSKTSVGEEVTGYDAVLRRAIITEATNRVTAGKLLRYQIQVQNNGPSDSQNVTIQDLLPTAAPHQPVVFESADGAYCRPSTLDQQTIFCTVGDMEAGARRTFDLYVSVDPSVLPGVIANCATALHSGSNVVPPGAPPAIPGVQPTFPLTWDPDATLNQSCVNTTVTAVADVFITKSDVPAAPELDSANEPDSAIAGREHRYEIRIGNDGPSVARTIGVTDLLDFKQPGILGETLVRCEPIDPDDQVTCTFAAPNTVTVTGLRSGNDVVIPGGVLNPGDRFGFYLITRVDSGYVLDGTDLLAEDTATITTATTDFHTQNNTDRHQTLIVAQADLEVSKTDIFGTDPVNGFLQCDPVAQGGEVRYTITVNNLGPSDAAQVLLVDQLPQGLVLDPAEVDITVSEGQVIDLNGAAPGQARDDGRIEVLIGNDPNNQGTAQIGRLNAPGTAGAGPVVVTIVTRVGLTTPCGSVLQNTVTVSTRRNDVLWPVAPQPFPGINGGPRTPTSDPNLINNTDDETTTVRCPSVKVTKTVSFNGTCPGAAVEQINPAGQPVTFCFEIENTGDTFLDTIQLTDTLRLRTETSVVFTDTITFGGDPLLPVAPGEKVRRQVTFRHLLAKWDCGLATDTVEVTAVPVNSGRTIYPCLPIVRDTDTATVAVPCAGVDFRLQLPIVGGTDCETWIQVQNVGSEHSKALLVFWGEPGFCPPQASGPLKAECSGLLKPGSAWSFAAGQVPNGANSAVIYSMNAVNSIRDIDGNLRPFADVACGALFDAIVGDWERWQAFDIAYRTRDIWRGPRDASGFQVVLDFGANLGEPLAATVNRTCPDPTDPNVVSSAAYTGVSSDLEGAYDPLAGGYTSYAPLVLAQRGGLSSILHIHNSGIECTSLEIWFKAQDACLRSTLGDVLTLSPGETVSFDVNTVVGPDWLGSAWIRASQPLGVVVDTVGPNHFTSYTGVPGDVHQLGFTYGDQVSFAPLIYNQMQGWDTALQVQNHSSHLNAKVKVYFLDQSGGVVSTVVDWICPRGSQTFFLPVIGGLPGNWVGSARVESQEWWSPGDPVVDPPTVSTTVLLEKWDDPARTNRREAVAYNGRGECLLYDWQIGSGDGGASSGSAVFAVPLLMKEYRGITSELAITNLVPKPGFTDFAIFIYDQNGLLDWVCQKLNEKQVEYINLASWGYVNPRFNGSAVISATFWEHDIFDKDGVFERNVVGLGGVAVERVGGVLGGPDIPGDESKAFEAMPIFDFFDPPTAPNCPGVP